MGGIKREHLAEAAMVLPSTHLLIATDQIIQSIYRSIHADERESITLAGLRDAPLPKLFSGKLWVKLAGKIVE